MTRSLIVGPLEQASAKAVNKLRIAHTFGEGITLDKEGTKAVADLLEAFAQEIDYQRAERHDLIQSIRLAVFSLALCGGFILVAVLS